MAGTNYTKGVFENGIYTNEYAGLKVKIPEELQHVSDDDLAQMQNELMMSITDPKDKKRTSASVCDASFWAGGVSISFNFLNARLAAPDDLDYTAEEYLDDYVKMSIAIASAEGVKVECKSIEKVTVGGEEYLRAYIVYDFQGSKSDAYFYARKLDDNLIFEFEIGGKMDKPIEDYEKLFE